MSNNKQQKYNPPDADDTPPPAYQETPPFNPNYTHNNTNGTSSSSNNNITSYQSPPFNPHYIPHSPPHTPDIHTVPATAPPNSLYPQIPPSFPQPQYQTIQIPYTVVTTTRRVTERRGFPLAAVFFLFGWFCPLLWIIGACCCAGSRNEYEAFWGKVNFIMAMVLIISSIIYSFFAMSQQYM